MALLEVVVGTGSVATLMPYRSKQQRAWMHIHEPEVATRWDRRYGGRIVRKARKRKR